MSIWTSERYLTNNKRQFYKRNTLWYIIKTIILNRTTLEFVYIVYTRVFYINSEYIFVVCRVRTTGGNTIIWTSRTKHGKGCRKVDERAQRKSRKEDIKCKSTLWGDYREMLMYNNEHRRVFVTWMVLYWIVYIGNNRAIWERNVFCTRSSLCTFAAECGCKKS